MSKKLNKIAQTTAEYAVLIAVVVGAVVAMQIYVRRGLQGRVRDVVDTVASTCDTAANAIFTGDQYEPYYQVSASESSRTANEAKTGYAGGNVEASTNEETSQNRQTITGWDVGQTATAP